MRITRINRIKRHRLFQDFSWPSDLPEFARFNLLYGWNGSGKTTLSNLLRYIERRQALLEGECDFVIDENTYHGRDLSTAQGLPRLRVFNRDFVAANFFASEVSVNPIFFLGEDSVEKQKQIESLRAKLDSQNNTIASKQSAKANAEAVLENFYS